MAQAQTDFVTAPSSTDTRTVFLEPGTTNISLNNTDLAALAATDDSQLVYARLYVATDEAGTLAADQTQLTFSGSGLDKWKHDATLGYIYFGSGFTTDMFSNITVSMKNTDDELSLSNYYVALQVSQDRVGIVYSKLVNKKWRFAKELPGHMGYSPSGDNGLTWYSAKANENAQPASSGAIYDDWIEFQPSNIAGGTYIHNAGTDGKSIAHKGKENSTTVLSSSGDFGSGDDAGYDVAVTEEVSTSWSFELDEDNLYIVLEENSGKVQFPFVLSDAQYNHPRFMIASLTENTMVLYDNSKTGDWRFRYVLIADDSSPINSWASATISPYSYYSEGTGDDWNATEGSTFNASEGVYTFTIPKNTLSSDWRAQIVLPSNLSINAGKYYNFSCMIRTESGYVDNALIRLQEKDNGAKTLLDVKQTINQDAVAYICRSDIPGIDIDNLEIRFDFSHPRQMPTTVIVSDIMLSIADAPENGQTIIKEPSDMTRLVMEERTFKGTVEAGKTISKGFAQSVDVWNGGNREFTIAFDKANGTISLLNSGGATLETLTMTTAETTFWDGVGDKLYTRWFWRKKGETAETYIANSIGTADGGAVYYSAYKPTNSVAWSSKNADGATINQVMRIKLDGTPDGGSSFHLFNYELVCTIGTTGEEDMDEGHHVKTEPKTLQYEYVFAFNTTDPFVSPNVDELEIIYKDAPYSVVDGKGTISPSLFANWRRLTYDLNSNLKDLAEKCYARWYVIDNNGDIVDGVTFSDYDGFLTNEYGCFRYKFEENKFLISLNNPEFVLQDYTGYDPVITLPSGYDNTNTKVVCVVTLKTDDENNLPYVEFAELEKKYIFTPWTEEQYVNLPFIHSQGQSERPYDNVGDDTTQYTWESVGDSYNPNVALTSSQSNVRQSVHTVEYYIYVNSDTDPVPLYLPLQNYKDGGNNTEPMAYVRWYDWNTDRESGELGKVGARLSDMTGTGKAGSGLMGIMMMGNRTGEWNFATNFPSCHSQMGVVFNPPTGFSSSNSSYDIACDLSKYMDGLSTIYLEGERTDASPETAKAYLIHEPTLSVRYLFHILPAKKLADDIANENRSSVKTKTLAEVESALQTNPTSVTRADLQNMFKLYEDNGRVSVSLNNGVGSFSMRTNLDSPSAYYINNGGVVKQCTGLQWVIYYEDASGIWKMPMSMNTSQTIAHGWDGDNGVLKPENDIIVNLKTNRIGLYTISDFVGNYTLVSDPSATPLSLTEEKIVGRKFNVVGMLSDDADGSAPVIHYELQFLDAAPLAIGQIKEERTEAYLHKKLMPDTDDWFQLTFDNYYRNDHSTSLLAPPTDCETNYATIPLSWKDAQYGFSYPQLYGLNATDYMCQHYEWWRGFGISPLHGDYVILKSMNKAAVSQTGLPSETYPQTFHNQWFRTDELYDMTHVENSSDYGAFLYVDAADESRTIASLSFNAKGMCAGSEFYYTAYIADMTDNTGVAPQVLFRVFAKNTEGKKVPLVAFHTGDLNTELLQGDIDPRINSKEDPRGKWYQVYGHATIPYEVNMDDIPTNADGSRTYIVEIDNYSVSTSGADYCVDNITFFTSAAEVQVQQNNAQCVEDAMTTSIYMAAENLQSTTLGIKNTPQNIYYRICTADGSAVTGPDRYGAGMDNYGTVSIITNYETQTIRTSTDDDYLTYQGYYKGSDGKIYYRLAYKDFGLDTNINYYISIFTLGGVPEDETTGVWGSPSSSCTVYSSPFKLYKVYATLLDEGVEFTTLNADCNGFTKKEFETALMIPNNNDDFVKQVLTYDYFVGTMKEYKDAMLDGVYLNDAITAYRETINSEGLDDNYQTTNPANYAVLKQYVDNGKLILSHSSTFEYEFVLPGEYTFMAIPVEKFVNMKVKDTDGEMKDKDVAICFPVPFAVKYDVSHPMLELGFADVTYPTQDGYPRRVVRLGLEQLDNLRNSHILHVPVHHYTNKEDATNKTLTIKSDLRLFDTNDPTFEHNATTGALTEQPVIATFEGTIIDNSTHQYIALNFHGSGVKKPTLHEGYEYWVSFMYKDTDEADDSEKCSTDMQFILRIVPEYVTWTKKGDGDNANWLNDENWTRSVKEELFSSTYEDNSSTLGQPKSFVPMKFTYVTLPEGNRAPNLTVNPVGSASDEGKVGILLSTASADGSDAPRFIEYDMLARYGKYDGVDNGGLCISHGIGGSVYDCEKFYGNVCNEIYFKPGAELLNQQYLDYNKAWVEKKLVAGKWYLMSAPLQDTYSGDMYVPATNGQQQTEAFKPITFDEATYSRTKYPVYQRSWGTAHESMVYVSANDVRSDYTANLPFDAVSSVSNMEAVWSHTFNDVGVKYNELNGFSVRAHKLAQADDAIIRLPKADTQYSIYSWEGASEPNSTGTATAVAKPGVNRLVTDGQTNGEVTVVVTSDETATSQLQRIGDYVLVGNPYMASIDMDKFFDENGITDKSYWTYEASEAVANNDGTGRVKPLQSFFIKAPASLGSVKFTPAMMTDGNHPTNPTTGDNNGSGGNTRQMLTLSAHNAAGGSKASVVIDQKASAGFVKGEDVETLFDSNLSDVPMVYTVAGQQAVSFDVRPQAEALAFGVTCPTSNETVPVTFTGMGQVTVLDVADGSTTTVVEGGSYDVQPNDYGRYYLAASGTTGIRPAVVGDDGIVVSVRDREVTVRATEALHSVRALTAGGTLVYGVADCGNETSFAVNSSGVYIVEAVTGSSRKTVKVLVR